MNRNLGWGNHFSAGNRSQKGVGPVIAQHHTQERSDHEKLIVSVDVLKLLLSKYENTYPDNFKNLYSYNEKTELTYECIDEIKKYKNKLLEEENEKKRDSSYHGLQYEHKMIQEESKYNTNEPKPSDVSTFNCNTLPFTIYDQKKDFHVFLQTIAHLPFEFDTLNIENSFYRNLCNLVSAMRQDNRCNIGDLLALFLNSFSTQDLNINQPDQIMAKLLIETNLIKSTILIKSIHHDHEVAFPEQSFHKFIINNYYVSKAILQDSINNSFQVSQNPVDITCDKCHQNYKGKEILSKQHLAKVLIFVASKESEVSNIYQIESINIKEINYSLYSIIYIQNNTSMLIQ